MIRNEFIELVTSIGLATQKDLRRLSVSDEFSVSEFGLLTLDTFDEKKFATHFADIYKIKFMDLANAKVAKKTTNILRKKYAIKFRAIPIQVTSTKVTLATFDPLILAKTSEISEELKKPVDFILTTISSWKKIFDQVDESVDEILHSIQEVKSSDEGEKDLRAEDISEDIVTYANRILADAFIKKASDIHIEPYEKYFRIRYRMDGNLVEVARPPRSMMLPLISRIKILSQMDISEKRKPQDGRIKLLISNNSVDFRVSSLPTLFGEKVVLRILDQSNLELDMTKLGFEPKQLEVFKKGIYKPHGMVLVTGPTGSGKTTTLYSALSDLNKPDVNISTAEDPCEFNLEGINQVNVKKEVGVTFASALKAFLRQDPDIIMVGEIRDLEVGETAIEAALTGHLVLSTLHTNDAPSTITRLVNMGIEPFLVTSSLNVVVAQRLLRRLCTSCKEPISIPENQLVQAGFAPQTAQKITLYKSNGCELCNQTGYKGRIAIYEVLEVTQQIRDLILAGASNDQIKMESIKNGMKTLRMSALTKVAMGLSTLEEALANSSSDN